MTTSLKTRTFRNIGYNAAAQCAMLIMQALANIVLARELASDDYGIIGFSMIFINFLGQFSDFGLNSAVIQEKKFDDKALYTGFTIKAILGLVACAASLTCAPLAEMIFDNRAVVAVIQLLSLNLLINSMSFLPLSLLTRELNYKKIAASQILSTLANAFVSIVLALGGYKYWSIVGGTLGTTIVTAIMMNSLKPVKIRFSLDMAKAREYLRFGGNLFLSGLLVFFVFNADNLIIGTTKGAQTLGYYSLAFTWGAMISVLMGAVITGVLFPTFSRIQEDRERIKKGYLQILEVIAFLGAMANISLYVAAREFLYFLLGNGSDKWMPALATFRIFCFYGIIRVVLEPVGAVIMALGHTRLFVRATGLVAVLEGVFLYPVAMMFGIEGVAVLVTVSYLTQYFVYFPALKSEIGLEYRDLFASLKLSIFSALVIVVLDGLIVPAGLFQFGSMQLWFKLLASAGAFFVLYGMLSRWAIVREARALLASMRA